MLTNDALQWNRQVLVAFGSNAIADPIQVYTMPAVDSNIQQIERLLAVNVLGPMRMVHHFHRMLVSAKGTIVNIGSIAGVTPYCYQCKVGQFLLTKVKLITHTAGYNASKSALHHWGNTLRVELQPFGYISPLKTTYRSLTTAAEFE